jgi:DNA-binding phage protein
MGSSATKIKAQPSREEKRAAINERFGNPKETMVMMGDFVREGDISSLTDLISSYISNSPKYKNLDEFAEAIGTSRATLYRMLSNDENVSMRVLFAAVHQIFNDAKI